MLENLETPRIITNNANILQICSLGGAQVAAVSEDGWIKIWNIENGQCLRMFNAQCGALYDVCSLGDGRLATISQGEKGIKIWDIKTGRCVQLLEGHDEGTRTLCLLDNDRLASGSLNGKVKLWNLQNGKRLKTFMVNNGPVGTLVYLGNDRLLSTAHGDDDAYTKLWDLHKTKCLKKFENGMNCCEVERGQFAFISFGGLIEIMRSENGDSLKRIQGHGGLGIAYKTACLGDSRIAIAIPNVKNSLEFWDIVNGKKIQTLQEDFLNDFCFVDNKYMCGGAGTNIKVWKVMQPKAQPIQIKDEIAPLQSSPESEIFKAVSQGDGKKFSELLQNDLVSADVKNEQGDPLSIAILKSQNTKPRTSYLQWLPFKQAKLDAPGQGGLSALCFACQEGLVEEADYLIEQKANVNFQAGDKTPLILAVLNGHASIVQALIKAGADKSIKYQNKTLLEIAKTPTSTYQRYAIKDCPIEIIKLLQPEKVEEVKLPTPAVNKNPSLDAKTIKNQIECLKNKVARLRQLRRSSPHQYQAYNAQLITAIIAEQADEVERLLKLGANPDGMIERTVSKVDLSYPAPLLLYAIETNNIACATLLICYGANPNLTNIRGYAPLMAAAYIKSELLLEVLLFAGADVLQKNEKGYPALYFAAEVNFARGIQQLCDAGANIDEDANNCTCTALYIASEKNHYEAVETLLNNKANVEKGKRDVNYTPLQIACENSHFQTVQLLCRFKANINHQSNSSWTPLLKASEAGSVSIVKYLLSLGAEVNYQTEIDTAAGTGGFTALHQASENGHIEIVDILLKAGAKINTQSARGSTALKLAVISNRLSIIQRLLQERTLDPNLTSRDNRWCFTPFHEAVVKGFEEAVAILLADSRVDFNHYDYSFDYPLITAIQNGFTSIALRLLKQPGINVNVSTDFGETPLSIAMEKGNIEVENKLRNMPGIKTIEEIPLIAAARRGDIQQVRYLITTERTSYNNNLRNNLYNNPQFLTEFMNNIFDPDVTNSILAKMKEGGRSALLEQMLISFDYLNQMAPSGETAIFEACKNNRWEVIKELIQYPVLDVNRVNKKGIPPLYAACDGNREAAIREIAKSKTLNPNKACPDGTTPLCIAASFGYVEAVKALLAVKSVNPNFARPKVGNDGHSPLTFAVRNNHLQVVEILAALPSIDVNHTTAEWNGGNSALTLAASAGNAPMLKILLKHPSINHNIRNIKGNTALALAAWNCHKECVEILVAHPKIDINLANDHGNTPLILASCNKEKDPLETIQILFERAKKAGKQIAIDRQDNDGDTALICAALHNNAEALKYLAGQGANLFITNKEGLTARYAALKNGRMRIAMYLKEAEDSFLQKQLVSKQKELQAEIKENDRKQEDLNKQLGNQHNDALIQQLQAQIKVLQTEHDKLFNAYEIDRLRLEAEDYLQGEPLLKAFNYHLQYKLSCLFMAYKVTDSGQVDASGSKTASRIELLGEYLPLPGAELVCKAIAYGINKYTQMKYEKISSFISRLCMNIDTLDKAVRGTGRLLTFQYEEQIMSLKSEEQAKLLAECAVKILITLFNEDNIDPEGLLSEQLAQAITNPSLKGSAKKIGTLEVKPSPWTDRGIFQKTGIELLDGRCYIRSDSEADLYGYRLGTEQQAILRQYNLTIVSRPMHPLPNNPFRIMEKYIPTAPPKPSPYGKSKSSATGTPANAGLFAGSSSSHGASPSTGYSSSSTLSVSSNGPSFNQSSISPASNCVAPSTGNLAGSTFFDAASEARLKQLEAEREAEKAKQERLRLELELKKQELELERERNKKSSCCSIV